MRRIGRHHLTGYELVKHHADSGEMLLHRRSRQFTAEMLDICGHMHRLNERKRVNLLPFASEQKRARRLRVPLADFVGEEFEETQR